MARGVDLRVRIPRDLMARLDAHVEAAMPTLLTARYDEQYDELRAAGRAALVIRALAALVDMPPPDTTGDDWDERIEVARAEQQRTLAGRLEGDVYGVRDSYDTPGDVEQLRRAAAAEAI